MLLLLLPAVGLQSTVATTVMVAMPVSLTLVRHRIGRCLCDSCLVVGPERLWQRPQAPITGTLVPTANHAAVVNDAAPCSYAGHARGGVCCLLLRLVGRLQEQKASLAGSMNLGEN